MQSFEVQSIHSVLPNVWITFVVAPRWAFVFLWSQVTSKKCRIRPFWSQNGARSSLIDLKIQDAPAFHQNPFSCTQHRYRDPIYALGGVVRCLYSNHFAISSAKNAKIDQNATTDHFRLHRKGSSSTSGAWRLWESIPQYVRTWLPLLSKMPLCFDYERASREASFHRVYYQSLVQESVEGNHHPETVRQVVIHITNHLCKSQ